MPRGKIEHNSEKRRQEILMAALDCFMTKSFSETTMNDIQKRSGASMGSIYHHFDNKEKLAAELYLEGITSLHNALRQVLETIKEAEVGIKGLVKAYIDWVKTNPDLGHYLFQGMSAQYLQLAGEKIREESLLLRKQIWNWFEPHITAGEIANLPRELYGPLLFGPTRDYLQQWVISRHQESDDEEIRRCLAEASWQALTRTR